MKKLLKVLAAFLLLVYPMLSLQAENYSPAGPPQIYSVVDGSNYSYPASPDAGGMMRWSDPGTWVKGAVPGPGDEVIIPEESAVVIDTDVEVGAIIVNGQLVVHPELESVSIRTEYMLVKGNSALFEWGTEEDPWRGDGVLTLVGTDPAIIPTNYVNSIPPENSKGIMVWGGGTMHIHGIEKRTWTFLLETAEESHSVIKVDGDLKKWNENDQIVVATSLAYDFDLQDFWGDDAHLEGAEVRRIKRITRYGGYCEIQLDAALNYNHYGNLQTYSNGSQTWTLDERTEVGMLTQNILIQGDESSVDSHHGGHIMVMPNGKGYMSGVELYRMGQQEFKARYPFHWHLAKDVSGQYIRNCSLHDLYFRAVTVHGTQNANVSGNVVFETQGHAIFLEDAVESGNEINGNLVMNVRRPPLGIGANSFIGADRSEAHIRARGPGAFWITNPSNEINDNHVAGVQGIAFWYGLEDAPTGPSANDPTYNGLQPNHLPMISFDNNVAHGAMTGFHQDHKNDDSHPDGSVAGPYFINSAMGWQEVSNFTAYHCYRGWWTRTIDLGIDFTHTILADCKGEGMTVTAFKGRTHNSLFVGHSANPPFGNPALPNQAISLYDGYMAAYDSHFEDFDNTEQSIFAMIGGSENRSNNIFTGCTFSNTIFYDPVTIPPMSGRLMSVSHDVDGIYTAPWGAVCVYHPFMVDDVNFTTVGNAKSRRTDEHFAALRIFHDYNQYFPAPRTNPDAGNQYMEWDDGHCIHTDERLQKKSQYPVVPNLGRIYKLRMLEGTPSPLDLHLMYAMNGDVFDIQVLDSPSSLSVTTSGYSQKTSEAAVWSSSTNAWYWNASTNVLSIRMIAAGATGSGVEEILTAHQEVRVVGGNKATLLQRDSRPFGGTYRSENTRVEAEWYDYGGQFVAYSKALPPEMIYYFTQYPVAGNQATNLAEISYGRKGELLRMYQMGTNDFAVKDIDDDDFVRYSFESPSGYTADFKLRYALETSGSIEVYINGSPAWTGAQTLASTGSATSFSTVVLPQVTLSSGINVVEIRSNVEDFSYDWFSIGDDNVVPEPAPICKTDPPAEAPIAEKADIRIHPNPVSDILTVEVPEGMAGEWGASVTDMQGRILMSVEPGESLEFDLSGYAAGSYVVVLNGTNGETERRVIIKE